jgi:hypothetical protein
MPWQVAQFAWKRVSPSSTLACVVVAVASSVAATAADAPA